MQFFVHNDATLSVIVAAVSVNMTVRDFLFGDSRVQRPLRDFNEQAASLGQRYDPATANGETLAYLDNWPAHAASLSSVSTG